MTMTLRTCLIVLTALAVVVPAPSRAQSTGDPYSIMRPEPGRHDDPFEPWLAPKYKSPRGVKRQPVPRIAAPDSNAVTAPPPIVVPQTGRALPNLPAIGVGPGGAETGQDRALRCTHQAGIYGQAAGDRGTYIGSCINQ